MSSARQLLYQKIEGAPAIIYSAYIENMRPLREAEGYWRFVDTKSWVDGPPEISTLYTKENIVWRAEIDSLDDTKIHLYNETNDLPGISSFTLTHTESVVAVSLEFDQLGRAIIVFEDTLGNINLYWYDPISAQIQQIVLATGITPHICSTRYFKSQGSADSERLIFYCKPGTGTVHYRRQDDRYGVEYDVDPSVTDVLEVLAASKNLYGGLTVVAARQNVDETVEVISWTARQDAGNDDIVIGSDRDAYSIIGTMAPSAASFPLLSIAEGLVTVEGDDSSIITASAASLISASIADSVNTVEGDDSSIITASTAVLGSAAITNILVTVAGDETSSITASSAATTGISIQAALITLTSYNEDVIGQMTPSAASLTGATIG